MGVIRESQAYPQDSEVGGTPRLQASIADTVSVVVDHGGAGVLGNGYAD